MVRPSARDERQPHAQRLPSKSGLSPELLRQAAIKRFSARARHAAGSACRMSRPRSSPFHGGFAE